MVKAFLTLPRLGGGGGGNGPAAVYFVAYFENPLLVWPEIFWLFLNII